MLGAYTDLGEKDDSKGEGKEKKEKEETPLTVENLTKHAKAYNEKTKGALLKQLNW